MVPCSSREVIQILYLVQIFPLYSCIFSRKKTRFFPFLFLFTFTLYRKQTTSQSGIFSMLVEWAHPHEQSEQGRKNPVRSAWNMTLPFGLAPSNLRITFLVMEELDVSFSLWNRIWTWNLFFKSWFCRAAT